MYKARNRERFNICPVREIWNVHYINLGTVEGKVATFQSLSNYLQRSSSKEKNDIVNWSMRFG